MLIMNSPRVVPEGQHGRRPQLLSPSPPPEQATGNHVAARMEVARPPFPRSSLMCAVRPRDGQIQGPWNARPDLTRQRWPGRGGRNGGEAAVGGVWI
ncbi:hypothetical protein E2562_024976 [Oryza meyeriana var. granulata]|uniref:Uncharacterized protein n=1 Tax=Oryza meyeriana var. granulata TaxID=110450 RepID=A0A6G1DN81_9ORYZ|nr:hypothetical protein E2562_024976 [Oryza meyeriana var. granulata]